MPVLRDGKSSPLFRPIPLKGNITLSGLAEAGASFAVDRAPRGSCVCWGIPFEVADPVLLKDGPVAVTFDAFKSPWLVVMHTADFAPMTIDPFRGVGQLGKHAADYVYIYSDNSEERVSIKRRHQIGGSFSIWGENCFEAVSHSKPRPLPGRRGDTVPNERWG